MSAIDWNADLLPWVESNRLYPDYPALTLLRLLIIVWSAIFFKLVQLFFTHCVGLSHRRAFKAVSMTHSCIAVTSSYYVLTTQYALFTYATSTCKPIQYAEYVCCVSFGYFCYDLYKTITQEPGLDFIMHGSLCIVIYGIVIHTAAGHAIGLSVLLYESSTFFLHLYAFLHYAHYDFTASVMRFAFAALFFIVRIVFGSYVTMQLLHAYILKPDWMEWDCVPPYKYMAAVAINLAFHVLNLYWFKLIVAKAFKVWKQGKTHAFERSGEELEFDKRRQNQAKTWNTQKKES